MLEKNIAVFLSLDLKLDITTRTQTHHNIYFLKNRGFL